MFDLLKCKLLIKDTCYRILYTFVEIVVLNIGLKKNTVNNIF